MKLLHLLTILIFVVGCTSAGQIKDYNIRSGSTGVTMKFLDQSPPPVIYAKSPSAMTFELANLGATSIEEGYVSFATEEDIVHVQGDRIRPFGLQGKSPGYPAGDQMLLTAQLQVNALPPQTTTLTTSMGLNVCYPYQTVASANVCVDTDVVGRTAKKPCTPSPVSLSSQGGPVAVTRIEPTLIPQEKTVAVQVLITINNVGNGQLYAQDKSLEACSAQSTGAAWNTAVVTAMLADNQLVCNDNKPVLFTNKAATVRCELPGGMPKTAGTYTTTMTVQVDYGYTSSITKQVQVKSIS